MIEFTCRRLRRPLALIATSLTAGWPLLAAAQIPAVSPVASASDFQTRTASLPAKGLFEGDQLSPAARLKLAELIINAVGLQVDVALVVPTGPWRTDGSGRDERDLTPARLATVKRFLTERGIDPKHLFVESRIDQRSRDARLDVQIGGRPASD